MAAQRVLLGRIAGAHGLRGEVTIRAYTAKAQDIKAYGPLSDLGGARSFTITSVKVTTKGVIARLKGVDDRTAALALKGVELYVDRDRLPAAVDDEFYHADLVGLAAVDREGNPIGRIVAVHNFGAGDLIEVALAGSQTTEYVPFTSVHVPEIDVPAGRAVVGLPGAGGKQEP